MRDALAIARTRGRAKVNLVRRLPPGPSSFSWVDPIKLAWESLHSVPFPDQLIYEHRGKGAKGNSRHWNISPEKLSRRSR